jgi:Concanavalin A-like lectin/glucanases superfamily
MVAQQQVLLETGFIFGHDPYWSNVKLLLGFNGANGSTGAPGMTDESSAAHGTATVYAAPAQISTAQAKFGGSSLSVNGTDGCGITFPDSNDWDFAFGPFTIEGFFRFVATPSNALLISQWSNGWAFYFEGGSLKFRSGSIIDTTAYTWAPTLNQWFHVVVDRDVVSTARIYVDGAMVSKTTSYTPNLSNSTAALEIGTLTPGGFNGYNVNGFIDEIRITNGVARYASDAGYPVVTAPFPRF